MLKISKSSGASSLQKLLPEQKKETKKLLIGGLVKSTKGGSKKKGLENENDTLKMCLNYFTLFWIK